MDNQETMQHSGSACNCGKFCGCGMHSGHKHYMLRWLLGLIILGIVFSMGVKIGEFKGAFEAGYGFENYGHHNGGYNMMYGGRGMMGGYFYGNPYGTVQINQETALPQATTSPIKK